MFGRPIAITGGIFQIRAIGARVTVVVEDGEALLIDAGLRGSSGTILQGLETLGLFPEQIGKVVTTHAHPDHSGGLSRLVAGREIAVAVHRLEADIIAGTAPIPSPLQNGLIGKMTQPVVGMLMGSPVPVDDRLDDGDVIPFGTEVRVVHLPGHTEGSIALHLPYKGTIIVGDTLQYKFARRLGPPALGVTQRPNEASGRLRNFWAWASIPCASVTSLPCVRSLAKPYEGLFNNTLHDWCGGYWTRWPGAYRAGTLLYRAPAQRTKILAARSD